eukprot:GHVR01134772.1.p1 GENE.GHVR01134772.1~~GHVR01134772.1.p1  ORF type:complete len:127 (-),score=14.83 GHVR01134772.1:288-668(-)
MSNILQHVKPHIFLTACHIFLSLILCPYEIIDLSNDFWSLILYVWPYILCMHGMYKLHTHRACTNYTHTGHVQITHTHGMYKLPTHLTTSSHFLPDSINVCMSVVKSLHPSGCEVLTSFLQTYQRL